MNNLDLVWSSRCCPGCSLHDHWHQGASLATRRSEGGSQGSYLGQECHEFCELHIQSFMPYECWVAMPKNENEKWVTDNQCLFPNRDTFCPIFTPIRHFFWLSLFSLPVCTFFGHFLSMPRAEIGPKFKNFCAHQIENCLKIILGFEIFEKGHS